MKPYSEYPQEYRAAVLSAAAGPHRIVFEHSKAAYSFRMRVWWMQNSIKDQADAPSDLRAACAAVRWTGPKLNEYGTWTLTGTTEPRQGLTDADVIGAMKGGSNE